MIKLAHILLLISVSTQALLNLPAQASLQTGSTVSAELAEDEVSLRQAVIIKFEVRNHLAVPVVADLGFDRKEAFRLSITKLGKTKTRISYPAREGIGRSGEVTIKPGGTYSQEILLNEWTEFSSPGKYLLELSLINPIRSVDRKIELPRFTKKLELTVVEKNADRLDRHCAILLSRTLSASAKAQALESALALSYVVADEAVPYLIELIQARRGLADFGIGGLVRIGSLEAVRELAAILKTGDPEIAPRVRAALHHIGKTSYDTAIKEAVRKALMQEQ
jgi:hypothetical protein